MPSFFVKGLPQAQGSSRAFVTNGRAVITSTNRNLKEWRGLVADVAQPFFNGPTSNAIELNLEFYMPRPKSLPKRVVFNTKRPDIDKLVRAVMDALTHVAWRDDSQVVLLSANKVYAHPEGIVGIHITVNDYADPLPVTRKRVSSITPKKGVL